MGDVAAFLLLAPWLPIMPRASKHRVDLPHRGWQAFKIRRSPCMMTLPCMKRPLRRYGLAHAR